jgi:hypothetical protein
MAKLRIAVTKLMLMEEVLRQGIAAKSPKCEGFVWWADLQRIARWLASSHAAKPINKILIFAPSSAIA